MSEIFTFTIVIFKVYFVHNEGTINTNKAKDITRCTVTNEKMKKHIIKNVLNFRQNLTY